MAIKIGVKKRKTAAREFTDRIKPQQAFWNCYQKVRDEGSTIITYYGAGGVGKSSLLKKLMEEVQTQKSNQTLRENVAVMHYDFENDFDTRTILQNLKLQLMAEGCEFPLFETGDFYYSLKTGNADETNPPKIKSMMEKNFWLSKLKKHWSPIISTLDTFMPGIKAITTAMTIAGNLLVDYWRSKQMLDEEHEEINARLDEAKMSDNPNDICKILPELFARDVTDWLNDGETNKILVVFLDIYEKLVNETDASPMQRSRDLWLRSEEGDPTGIIFIIPRTLWVIAGRNKLRWDGELSEEMDQHLITALSEDDSDYFLKKSGVENSSLRKDMITLTQGLPIFLDLCVTFYEKYKQRNGTEPTIAEFGVKHQEVVDRLIKYMDAPTQDMIKFLCALNQWTDEIAFEIGSEALPNFSMSIYNQAKNFSFIQLEDVQINEIHSEIYTFDKTVQGIIFPTCDKPVLQKIGDVADKYFDEKIQNSQDDDEYIFNICFWAKLAARVADDSKSLTVQYADRIVAHVNNLVDFAKFDIAEDIVNTFLEKAGSLDNFDGENYAYFHVALANIKQAQGFYEDALKLNQYFYDTCLNVFGEKDIHTLTAMNNLANVLRLLEKFDEALELQKKVLETAQEMFGDKDIFTLTAMGNLSFTLSHLGLYEEAEELERKVLDLREEMLGDEHPRYNFGDGKFGKYVEPRRKIRRSTDPSRAGCKFATKNFWRHSSRNFFGNE